MLSGLLPDTRKIQDAASCNVDRAAKLRKLMENYAC